MAVVPAPAAAGLTWRPLRRRSWPAFAGTTNLYPGIGKNTGARHVEHHNLAGARAAARGKRGRR